MMVDPTNVNPRFLRSLEILSESGVLAGISERLWKLLIMGSLST